MILCVLATIISAIAPLVSSIVHADSVVATITVGTGPYGALFNPITGHVYTADIASSTVSVIDTCI